MRHRPVWAAAALAVAAAVSPALSAQGAQAPLVHVRAVSVSRTGAPVGNSDAHVLEGVASGWTSYPGVSADDYRNAIAARTVEPAGAYWSHWHNVSVYGRQLMAKARHVRHTLRPTGEWR